ncbi:MAG: MFS transporter [Methylovirgula sp.]
MDSKLLPKSRAKFRESGSQRARALGAAIATVTIVGTGLSLSMTLLAVRLAERGFSARAIGVNAAAGGLATLLTAPFVPGLAQRVGVKPLLIVALLAGAASLAALAATEAYWTWFALRSLFGAALTILFALSEFWISSAAPYGRRGAILGIYTAGFALGAALGPSILALIGTQGSAAFLAATALFLIASLPIALLGGKAPVLARPARTSVLAAAAALPAATSAALLYGAIETGVMGLLPVYALRSGMGAETGAILVTIFALGNGVLQIPVGLMSDRFDRRGLLALAAGVGAIGALFLPWTREAGFVAFAALLFVWGGIVGSLYALGLAYLGAGRHGSELASGNAAYILFYSVGMLAGPPAIGLGLDVAPAGFFVALALMLAAYFGLVAAS